MSIFTSKKLYDARTDLRNGVVSRDMTVVTGLCGVPFTGPGTDQCLRTLPDDSGKMEDAEYGESVCEAKTRDSSNPND